MKSAQHRKHVARKRWQKEKRESTRTAVLEAAMGCFIKYGYAKTSTPLIAQEAGMSRGAIVHYFPTRHSLLSAVVEYLHDLRIRQYADMMQGLDRPTEEIDREKTRKGVRTAWTHINLPSFAAYQELLAASRTDEELWSIMAPLERKSEEQFVATVREVFPRWSSLEEFTLANDLVQFALKGMALSPIQQSKKTRIENVLNKLTEVLDEMYQEASQKKANTGQNK